MEKPTGVIQKIIESLQQINALDAYSPIEKDIILHNLRAAYMIFLNIPAKEEKDETRIERLFIEEKAECGMQSAESGMQNAESTVRATLAAAQPESDIIEEENEIEIENEIIKTEEEIIEEEIIEEETIEEETIEEETIEEETIEEETPELPEVHTIPTAPTAPQETQTPPPPLADDLLEFIPDAKPQITTLFEEAILHPTEKKSLNDLLTDKKDDNSLGTRFQQSFIPDLTKAIAINEKFTFIRELFRNSGVDFSNAIQKLNECENIDTAFVLMEELKHQYIWDTTSSAYLTLCDLVRRRFI